MTALDVFTYSGQDVRTVIVDGEPWFVTTDVAAILGYRDAFNLTRRLDEEDKGTHQMSTPGGMQLVGIINEPGLYAAVLGSQVASARVFKRWVTHEVLPQIRRTGEFRQTEVEHELPTSYADALRELAASVERQEALEAQAALDAPKVAAYDALMDADGYYSMEAAAKMCGLGRTTFYRRLREAGIIQNGSTLPYQRHMHHFVLTASSWTDGDGNVHPSQTTRVRPSGLPFLASKIGVVVKAVA